MPSVRFLLPGLILSVLLVPGTAESQSVTLDEGTMRIFIDGAQVGTETFAVRRAGSGADAQVIATAEIQMDVPEGRVDLRPALQASGSEMAVSAYQIRVTGHRQEEIRVELGDRRYRTRISSERGEQEREHRATPGTILLDTDVAHQYYFVTSRIGPEGGSVPVIVPREGQQFNLSVTRLGDAQIQIGGQNTTARHYRLEGNGETRELWVDGEGRVLRLEFTERGYMAEREQLP